MIHRIEVRPGDNQRDPRAEGVLGEIRELGLPGVRAVRSARLFFLIGELTEADARRAAEELLADSVVERFCLGQSDPGGASVIEVHLQPGVMDPVAASAESAIREMNLPIEAVRTARRYELEGDLSETERNTIATRLLANPVIEDVFHQAHTPEAIHGQPYSLEVVEVPIRNLSDGGLMQLSRDGHLFLDLHEMQAIRDHYRQLGREPRDVELEMIAQTWSEHCVHKTFRSDVVVRDRAGNEVERIDNLIKSTIFSVTRELDKPWCLSVFEDNAGVIAFDDERAVCFKVETHNHPSAIEPYGGASTGIGGVIRDPLGTGGSAGPVANTDVFCFGPPTTTLDDLPAGILHPRRVMRGVVAGVRDYGNRMGIPTVNGAVYFDEKYLGNPLVFCGTAAMLPREKATKGQPDPGDAVVVVGGRTGRDGIHGATFSSGELTHTHETEFSHAVQIGNAITEKKMLDVIGQARDADLFRCVTDCGAGGLSSAIGEMGETIGAEVHLDRVPLKYAGLSYAEIWISEAQERMVLAVPRENLEPLLALFAAEGVEATEIGTFGCATRPLLRLYYHGTEVGELDMGFLHDGLPRPTKEALWDPEPKASAALPAEADWNAALLKILAAPNVASKEWVIRQYDHEVQGGSVIKPMVGTDDDGPSDAAVVRPVLGSPRGIALSCGMNPRLGELDPYQSALHAVDEALRNLAAVGGNLDRTAILDNFCWGNCNKPDRMGALVQAAKACREAALAYETPFISGKDSLNNEFQTDDGRTIAIPPTLLISAISVLDDVCRCVTMDLKAPGNRLVLLGLTRSELAGSHVLDVLGLATGNDVPPVDGKANLALMRKLQQAIEAGLVRSCHDLCEGGLAVAAAEMAFAGGYGAELSLENIPCTGTLLDGQKLFAESAGRFLVEVEPGKLDALRSTLGDAPHALVGEVTDADRIRIGDAVDLPLVDAKAAWQKTFGW
jgi:phosphoribosylformylglycinamidine synthase subunit PurSL